MKREKNLSTQLPATAYLSNQLNCSTHDASRTAALQHKVKRARYGYKSHEGFLCHLTTIAELTRLLYT